MRIRNIIIAAAGAMAVAGCAYDDGYDRGYYGDRYYGHRHHDRYYGRDNGYSGSGYDRGYYPH